MTTTYDLSSMSLKQLAEVYNKHGGSINKFSDKKSALKRVKHLLAEAGVSFSGNTASEKAGTSPKNAKGTPVRKSRLTYEGTLTVNVEGNPKREGSTAHERFAVLRRYDGHDVANLIKAHPDWAAVELRYNLNKGFISVGGG